MATSAWPVCIRPMQEVTAWLAEMQAMVTVWPGVESGKPSKSEKVLDQYATLARVRRYLSKATCSESSLLGNVGGANLLLNRAGAQVIHLYSKWAV